MTSMPVGLLCPKCHYSMARQPTAFVCQGCGSIWEIRSSIVHLTNTKFYWGLLPEARMVELLAKARQESYQQAIYQILMPEKGIHIARYAIDESRDGFKVILPLSRDAVVLDIGSGWGAVAISLARSSKWVIAMDAVSQNLEFVHERALQEKVENITLLHADPLDYMFVPIKSESVDIVLLNGVLEWIGTALSEKSPSFYQSQALKEINRVLKPGGTIYIGIENRFGFPLLLGRPDSHSGLRFATLMPRFLASIYSRIIKRVDYRTYTYTRIGYESMLHAAGFNKVKFFWPVFTYQDPEYLVALDDHSALRYLLLRELYVPAKSVKKRLALRFANLLDILGILKFFVYSYSIIGIKK